MKRTLLFSIFLGSAFCLQAQTRDTSFVLESKIFGENRTISIHLPEDFSETDTLPVIYFFDAQWKPYTDLVNSTVDYLTAIHSIERSIVVGIHQINRQYELTPEPVNEDWKIPSLGGAYFLENHLRSEVYPTIELHFHPSGNSMGLGHSLGGTFVLNSLIDAPDLFQTYLAISPNLQLDEEEIALKLIRGVKLLEAPNKRVYATMGTEGNPDLDFLPSLEKLDTVLSKVNSATFSWEFEKLNGLSHATTPLESIYRGLSKLAIKKEKASE